MAELRVSELVIDIPARPDGDPLSFAVQPGQIWGVLGPNGAGKTTLLHTLAGLRRPRCGHIELNGRNLHRMRRRDVARQVAVVFQEREGGFPSTVLETALIGRHPYLAPWDMETERDIEIARQALLKMELDGLEPRLINTLSGGERQRLTIATALTQTPALWLADEPTNHLDLRHQVQIMELLTAEAAEGKGALLCLHDINLAARWCDHLLLLYPDGSACWGARADMLVPEALEKLYQQSLTTVEADGTRLFFPRPDRVVRS